MDEITDEARLREVIGETSAAIRDKARDHVDPVTAEFLAASPFFLLATTGPDGVDVSPRSDPAGCVLVLDERTVAFADRKGNRKLDSLRNILHDPRVGMIFVVPGSNDTVRVNGRARIVHRPDFADRLTVQGSTPEVAIVVEVEELFLHCAKAFLRSSLWDASTWPAKGEVPSAGKLVKGQYRVPGPARVIDAAMRREAKANRY
ncbi:MSMEG_1061 family FMN-dependent PPOX-type flavoprotein [Pseudonocardia sp. HH130630-07]|uniref:MSMEG_1061 family FMN-dependent PPOX-type flavoprotein n=1 Tax=Pseudonocardia sp. HH130630-07 TaxID=1690815 RepID=UPI000814E23F|nr:MSMEG_1061 family FMN-dependent PPOX-type flavoprotein [Pseudonocardia sp. HH130630-07]ANY08085.1 pyridoxamine 5'-phosphate oxidase [Pseudonocardia sp. HH130630-07]